MKPDTKAIKELIHIYSEREMLLMNPSDRILAIEHNRRGKEVLNILASHNSELIQIIRTNFERTGYDTYIVNVNKLESLLSESDSDTNVTIKEQPCACHCHKGCLGGRKVGGMQINCACLTTSCSHCSPEKPKKLKGDIKAVINMLNGTTDRQQIANYIKEYMIEEEK